MGSKYRCVVRIVFGDMNACLKLMGGVNISSIVPVFPGHPKKTDPAMAANTVTARRKGDPQLSVEGKGLDCATWVRNIAV